MTISLSPQHKKWLYQAMHRGTKEADRIVGDFIQHELLYFSESDTKAVDVFIALPDDQIMDFILQGILPQDLTALPILKRLHSFLRSQSFKTCKHAS